MVKSLVNRIYLKQKLFGFKMHQRKSINENIDAFTNLVLDVKSLGVKIEDEDQAMILFTLLPKVFDQLRDTLKYSKDSLSLQGVLNAIHAKEIDLRIEGIDTTSGEGLVVYLRQRGTTTKQEIMANPGQSQIL